METIIMMRSMMILVFRRRRMIVIVLIGNEEVRNNCRRGTFIRLFMKHAILQLCKHAIVKEVRLMQHANNRKGVFSSWGL